MCTLNIAVVTRPDVGDWIKGLLSMCSHLEPVCMGTLVFIDETQPSWPANNDF